MFQISRVGRIPVLQLTSSKTSNQPAHTPKLITAFVTRGASMGPRFSILDTLMVPMMMNRYACYSTSPLIRGKFSRDADQFLLNIVAGQRQERLLNSRKPTNDFYTEDKVLSE